MSVHVYACHSFLASDNHFVPCAEVQTAEVVTSNFYTLGGAKVAAPVKDINIVRSVLSEVQLRSRRFLLNDKC